MILEAIFGREWPRARPVLAEEIYRRRVIGFGLRGSIRVTFPFPQ